MSFLAPFSLKMSFVALFTLSAALTKKPIMSRSIFSDKDLALKMKRKRKKPRKHNSRKKLRIVKNNICTAISYPVHQVDVWDSATMHPQRIKELTDWFATQKQIPSCMDATQWTSRNFEGDWVCLKVSQEETFQKHWLHATSVNTDFWIELGIDNQWSFILFQT